MMPFTIGDDHMGELFFIYKNRENIETQSLIKLSGSMSVINTHPPSFNINELFEHIKNGVLEIVGLYDNRSKKFFTGTTLFNKLLLKCLNKLVSSSHLFKELIIIPYNASIINSKECCEFVFTELRVEAYYTYWMKNSSEKTDFTFIVVFDKSTKRMVTFTPVYTNRGKLEFITKTGNYIIDYLFKSLFTTPYISVHSGHENSVILRAQCSVNGDSHFEYSEPVSGNIMALKPVYEKDRFLFYWLFNRITDEFHDYTCDFIDFNDGELYLPNSDKFSWLEPLRFYELSSKTIIISNEPNPKEIPFFGQVGLAFKYRGRVINKPVIKQVGFEEFVMTRRVMFKVFNHVKPVEQFQISVIHNGVKLPLFYSLLADYGTFDMTHLFIHNPFMTILSYLLINNVKLKTIGGLRRFVRVDKNGVSLGRRGYNIDYYWDDEDECMKYDGKFNMIVNKL